MVARLGLMLMLIAIAGGFGSLHPDPASAQVATNEAMPADAEFKVLNGSAAGVGKRWATTECVFVKKPTSSGVKRSVACAVTDLRADRIWAFVVPQYLDGSTWRIFPGYQNRSCIVKTGVGTVRSCVHEVAIGGAIIPGDSVKVRIRYGIVDNITKKVLDTAVTSVGTIHP